MASSLSPAAPGTAPTLPDADGAAAQTRRYAWRLAATCALAIALVWLLLGADPDGTGERGIAGVAMSMLIAGFGLSLWRREQRQAQLMAALEASRADAQAASAQKSRFVASVSHELRTPLNGILGYAELIRDTSQDEQSREFGQIVLQSAKHLQALVDTILDLAKLESGRLHASVQQVDVATLLRDALAQHGAHAADRGLQLAFTLADDCPASVQSDGARLQQILNNLLNNAIKFTPAGSIAVRGERRGDALAVIVRDTGIGMSTTLQHRIFTRFHAVDGEFLHPAQGAGLGLPLCKELATLLGAELQVHSVEGSGTTMTLVVPCNRPPQPPSGSSSQAQR